MKKYFAALLILVGATTAVQATNPIWGTVQIGTTTTNVPTLQNGAINIASGTIQNLKTTFGISASTVTVSSNTVLPGATFYPNNGGVFLGQSLDAVTISSSAFLPGATFYDNTHVSLSSVTVTGPISNALAGLTATSGSIASSDSILTAFNKIANARIVQVQISSVTSSSATVSTTFTPSDSTVSITPTLATNRIFILASGTMDNSLQNNSCGISIANGTHVLTGTATMGNSFTATGGETNIMMNPWYLDSPATTSATSYTVYFKAGGANTCNWGNGAYKQIMAIEIGQ